jgi:hypothetical protein
MSKKNATIEQWNNNRTNNKVFGECTPKLVELWLTKSNVYGTLEFAKECPDLELIDIYGTQVEVEVEVGWLVGEMTHVFKGVNYYTPQNNSSFLF